MEQTVRRSKFALNEPLKLDQSTEVPGSVVELLACHQLEGIRFLHRGLIQNNGVILNDESGLGKTHQVAGYLSAVVGHSDKCVIVCDSVERIHHWMYHLELFTELKSGIIENYEQDEISDNREIFLTTFAVFSKIQQLDQNTGIKFVILDETKSASADSVLLQRIADLKFSKKLFIISDDLWNNLKRFHARLTICQERVLLNALDNLLEAVPGCTRSPLTKTKQLKLFFLSRGVYLRRYRNHYRSTLPLIAKSEFESYFASWMIANGLVSEPPLEDSQPISDETMVRGVKSRLNNNICDKMFDINTSRERCIGEEADDASCLNDAILGGIGNTSWEQVDDSQKSDDDNDCMVGVVKYQVSEPLFDFEQCTEDMPKLKMESSDSESRPTTDGEGEHLCTKPTGMSSQNASNNFEVPETERDTETPAIDERSESEDYLDFGQVLDCSTQIECVAEETDTLPTEDKYHFPIDRLLRRRQTPSSSSTDIEILSNKSTTANPVVNVQSSSSSNGAADKSKSPELFTDDSENELDETLQISSQDSFIDLLHKTPVNLEKTLKANVGLKAMPKNVSTPISTLMYGQLQMETEDSYVDDSSNDIFADITVKNRTDNVFEITENNAFGNKIQIVTDNERPSSVGDTDEVEFVCVVRKAGDPNDVINLDTEASAPKKQIGWGAQLTEKTPPKSGSTTPQGWLTKSSRASPSVNGSPRTPTTNNGKSDDRGSSRRSRGGSSGRRKRLESWFKDDDEFASRQRVGTSSNRRRSAPVGGNTRKPSPKKKCFQERLLQQYNKILVSPSGIDSDFE
ncbi:uncharacterized protein LOC129770439 [Toxorhynchites rutilus septentrionalis]|uniref:uncharacterized protein LOC129770439 n=1 Tax=Toxorhynchites rutilus septentrionalis TaxID=329112 RepID=UPI00247AB360|nr:uncharacterized protein LOC129770439 [Toxorhynchites rutilus septentrionalis]